MTRRQPSKAPKYPLPGTVYDAALNRIRWLFDEFDQVAVATSGGKDSTVVAELALIVARERGRLPLKVIWLDQECEFDATYQYQRALLSRPEVEPRWYQIPFRMFNATSHEEKWLHVWGEGEEWVRDKEPDSIHVNDFGTDRFVKLLHAIGDRETPGGAVLTGVRAEESPPRRMGLTTHVTYKWATWGTKDSKDHLIFHPIYDWTYQDVWKAIATGGWPYNAMYDHMFRYGVSPKDMRVSNYHHETAIHALFRLQEIEPETWERATRRLRGINTAGQIGKDDFFVSELPFMFTSWTEYRDYLLANLVNSDADRAAFAKKFAEIDRLLWYVPEARRSKACVQSLIANDVYGTKLENFRVSNRLKPADLERLGITRP